MCQRAGTAAPAPALQQPSTAVRKAASGVGHCPASSCEQAARLREQGRASDICSRTKPSGRPAWGVQKQYPQSSGQSEDDSYGTP